MRKRPLKKLITPILILIYIYVIFQILDKLNLEQIFIKQKKDNNYQFLDNSSYDDNTFYNYR